MEIEEREWYILFEHRNVTMYKDGQDFTDNATYFTIMSYYCDGEDEYDTNPERETECGIYLGVKFTVNGEYEVVAENNFGLSGKLTVSDGFDFEGREVDEYDTLDEALEALEAELESCIKEFKSK